VKVMDTSKKPTVVPREVEKIVSNYTTNAVDAREKLGDTLCAAKWYHTSLNLRTGKSRSCYHPPFHQISDEDLQKPDGLHNTEFKQQQRNMMANGIKVSECSYCWNTEKDGSLSDRHFRSGEEWAIDFYNYKDDLEKLKNVTPTYVEVMFSNTCQLQCSYCSPEYSSTWASNIRRYGPYGTSIPHNIITDDTPTDSKYIDKFWEWFPTMYPQLKVLRLTGGEPTIDKNVLKLLEFLNVMPHRGLDLAVTSSLSVRRFGQYSNGADRVFPIDNVARAVNRAREITGNYGKYHELIRSICMNNSVKSFTQYVSVDTFTSEKLEYARVNTNMNIVNVGIQDINQFNALLYKTKQSDKTVTPIQLSYIITMNVLNVTSIVKTLDVILKQREAQVSYEPDRQLIWFDTPILTAPSWQALNILPRAYQEYVIDAIEFMEANKTKDVNHPVEKLLGFRDFEIERMKSVLAFMKTTPTDMETLHRCYSDFYRFFSEYEQRNKLGKFEKVFPEMSEFWKQCQYYSRQTRRWLKN